MIWLSLSELAGVYGLPTQVAGVRRKSEREGWQCRDRQGRGGGKEYLLPSQYWTPEFQEALQQRYPDRFANIDNTHVKEVQRQVVGTDHPHQSQDCSALDRGGVAGLGLEAGDTSIATQSLPVSSDERGTPPAPPLGNTSTKVDNTQLDHEPPQSDLVLNARYEILKLWAVSVEVCKLAGGTAVTCDEEFVAQVKSGAIALPDWVRKGISSRNGKIKLNRATLHLWRNAANAGAAALRPQYKGKNGQDFFATRPKHEAACEAILAAWGDLAQPKFIQSFFVKNGKELDLYPEVLEVPSIEQVARWLRRFQTQHPALYKTYVTGDRKVAKPAFGSLSVGKRPNDEWQIDSTLVDLRLRDGDKLRRFTLVQVADTATRRRLYFVSATSNAEAIARAIRLGVLRWGVPQVVRTDNGKDYVSRRLRTFLDSLGIEQFCCKPFSPEQKGMVERGFGVLQRSADFLKLPLITGNSVAQRQTIRKREENADMANPFASVRHGEAQRRDSEFAIALTPAELQGWLDRWCGQYHDTVHAVLNQTPNERLAAFARDGWQPRMVADVQILDWLLLEESKVTLQRHGIRYQNRIYVAPELGAIEVGTKLTIRFDADQPDQIQVFRGEDLLCLAKWRDALSPSELAELAAKAKVASKVIDAHISATAREGRRLKKRLAKNPEILHEESAPMLRRQLAELPGAARAEQALQAIANPKPDGRTPKQEAAIAAQHEAMVAEQQAVQAVRSKIRLFKNEDWDKCWAKGLEHCDDFELSCMVRMCEANNNQGDWYVQAWLMARAQAGKTCKSAKAEIRAVLDGRKTA
jgi:transposase InsO family protein